MKKLFYCPGATRLIFTGGGPAAVSMLFIALTAFLVSCGGPQPGRVAGDGTVVYDDPQAVETLTGYYGSTDLQNTAEHMTQALLGSPVISQAGEKPRIRLREVINYTDEHIDTKGITDKIRYKLMSSGKVRFLADAYNMDQVYMEREFTETETEKQANEYMLESDYILTGAVRSIRKQTKKVSDFFYQITMELVNPQSGEIVWASEKEIRKTATKPTFGW